MPDPAADDALDALRDHAVELDGDTPDEWNLAPVADALADATVIGMGESTHGTHEHFRLKTALFRRLVEDHGVRLFGLEANYSETLAVDHYVRGVDDAPDSAADALAATYFWPWYVAELRDLVEWIRAFNDGRPLADQVRFFGFDAQYAVGGAAALQSFLADADPELLAAHHEPLAMLADWGLDRDGDQFDTRVADAREAIDAIRERFDDQRTEYVDATSERAVRRAELHLETMADAMALRDTEETVAALRRRDRAMADGVERLLGAADHDRIAIWAHNAHVMRSPNEYDGETIPRMGQHLAERRGDGYAALGFSFTGGSFQAMAEGDDGEYGLRDCLVAPAAEGSVGATLGAVDGSPLFLDCRIDDDRLDGFLDEKRLLRQPGGMYDPERNGESHVALADAFDALLHTDETTRAVPLDHPHVIND